jgi:hypothetical protein
MSSCPTPGTSRHRRSRRLRPSRLPPPGFAAVGDLPENYVPRHFRADPRARGGARRTGQRADPDRPPGNRRRHVRHTRWRPVAPAHGHTAAGPQEAQWPGTPLQVGGAADGTVVTAVHLDRPERARAATRRAARQARCPRTAAPLGDAGLPTAGFPGRARRASGRQAARRPSTRRSGHRRKRPGRRRSMAGDTVPTAQVADDATDLDAPAVDRPAAPPVAPGDAATPPGTPVPAAVAPTARETSRRRPRRRCR